MQVITIHKSKGLAFRAVFVPFCNWEIKGKANSTFWVSSAETVYKELRGIPLKYNEALADSAIAKAYYEELLYNNMDALNMLYVATTRSKDYLYIATMAKKELKLTNMGDVINLTFDQQFNGDGVYEIVDHIKQDHQAKAINLIALDHYPTTTRLSELYVPSAEKHLRHLVNIDKSGRKGSLLHDILANTSTEEEVNDYIIDLVLNGIVQEDEKASLKERVLEVLNNDDLRAILGKATTSITEKSIVDAKGKLHRPDRLLFNNDEVTILDYKFTLTESDQHIEQVKNYKTAVRHGLQQCQNLFVLCP